MARASSLLVVSAVGAALVATAGAIRSTQAGGIGSMLVQGMQLVYERDGAQSPWTIDSVKPFTASGMNRCVRIWLRTTAAQTAPELRAHCSDSSTMFNWDERLGRPRSVRPLSVGMSMETRQANGTLVRYEASAPTVERIRIERGPNGDTSATTAIDVIPTVVTTIDSTGKAVRRLRERFSVGLATATGGVFEVPDSTQASRWRPTLQFELVRIRMPR